MTRWARAGSTQKHSKLPGEATPWKEFCKNKEERGKKNLHRVRQGHIEKKNTNFNFKSKFSKFNRKPRYSHQDNREQASFKGSHQVTSIEIQNKEPGISRKDERTPKKFSINEEDGVKDVSVESEERKNNALKPLSKRQLKRANQKRKFAEIEQRDLEKFQDNNRTESARSADSGSSTRTKDEVSGDGRSGKQQIDSGINNGFIHESNNQESLEASVNGKKETGGLISGVPSNSTENRVCISGPNLSKRQLRNLKRKQKLQEMRMGKLQESQSNKRSAGNGEKHVNKMSLNSHKSRFQVETENSGKGKKLVTSEDVDDQETLSSSALTQSEGIHFPVNDVNKSNPVKLSNKQLKKVKREQMREQKKSEELQLTPEKSEQTTEECSEKSTTLRDLDKKKQFFLEKLQKKRSENRIQLLPPKVERKIYILKRRMREKGVSPGVIREVARKERRREEIKFRNTSVNKTCYNCRKFGHILEECPDRLESSGQQTGMCFKCSSTEHKSFQCRKKIEGFPLAKCFICKAQGHISRDCPQNTRGVYPKGGRCGICGNVNHLKKDCPTLKKKDKEREDNFTLQRINEGVSMDADIEENTRQFVKKESKAKIVKF